MMKVAKFLQASSCSRPKASEKRLAQAALSLLLDTRDTRLGAWPASIKRRTDPSLAATVEALLALNLTGSLRFRTEIQEGRTYLTDRLSKEPDEHKRRVIIWSLVALAHPRRRNFSERLLSHVTEDILLTDLSGDQYARSEFNDIHDRGDYYTFNSRFVAAHAVCTLLRRKAIPSAYIRSLIPPVQAAVDGILQDGFYRSQRHPKSPRFWEFAQAMGLLWAFYETVATSPELKEMELMLVNPRYFKKTSFEIRPDLAVVLMPLTQDWSGDLLKTFRSLSSQGLEVWRSDLVHRDDEIMQTLWQYLNEASFVIADCTGQNPNVFYELGIAHTLGKPVFICAQNRKDIPFDIAGIRSVEYGKPMPSNLKNLTSRLCAFVKELQT